MNKSGNENRSVRNTKKKLQDGLLTLMQEKPINNITVKELTNLVDINRGTFYFHYSDVFDLLYQIEDDFFMKFNNVLNAATPKYDAAAYPNLKAIFTFLAENQQMCRIFFSANCDMRFFNKIKQLVEDRCCYLWEISTPDEPTDEKRLQLYVSFIRNGCVGIIQKWLDDGLEETPEEISQIVGNIITSSIKLCMS